MMTPWEWVKCRVLGRCEIPSPIQPIDPVIELMEEGLAETRGIRQELQRLRESGIWHQDMMQGRSTPRPRRRKRPDA